MTDNRSSVLSVAVYAPLLQGFYFGELIGQLQQLCLVKGYHFNLINTRGLGDFRVPLGIAQFDVAIVLRNAIHPELVQQLRQAGVAVVAIAYDYFPLDVPVVSCDNEAGVELAFTHLIKLGHQNIAFIGDISQFDLRKRYEAYCDQHEINGFELDENNIIVVKNTLFSGGYEAAASFLKRDCKATAVICGAGLTGIGFAQRVQLLAPERAKDLDIVAFDAITMFPVAAPNVTIVDQNMYLLAYKALQKAERVLAHQAVERQQFVQPKLIEPANPEFSTELAYLATCVELSELHNQYYVKSLLSNFYEWPQVVGDSNLDDLMMIAPMFPRHMQCAILSRVVTRGSEVEQLKITRLLRQENTIRISASDDDSFCDTADFPVSIQDFDPRQFSSHVHLPIRVREGVWGWLSVFGENTHSSVPSSLLALSGYLALVVDRLEAKLLERMRTSLTQQQKKRDTELACGTVRWLAEDGRMEWDDTALGLMGFASRLEKSVYQHMEIADRIHEEDEAAMRELLQVPGRDEMDAVIRLRHKNRAFIRYQVTCSRDTNTQDVVCRLAVSQDNA